MAPSRKISPKKRKDRKGINLGEKLKILELLENGETVAAVGRKFGLNESTIRGIRDNKEKIRESMKNTGTHAKMSKVTRNPNVVQMEDLLIIWIQDLTHKRIPLDTRAIRQQALDFFNYLEEKSPTNFQFSASKGWFERFKDRFSIRNVKLTGSNISQPIYTTL